MIEKIKLSNNDKREEEMRKRRDYIKVKKEYKLFFGREKKQKMVPISKRRMVKNEI